MALLEPKTERLANLRIVDSIDWASEELLPRLHPRVKMGPSLPLADWLDG